MAKYSELISKFDKIRHYTRDFLVYGYHTRSQRSEHKKRSYDNEKRRIMSYLHDYIEENHSKDGKRVSINIDLKQIATNPLYRLWQTKSFTDNDIFLHFVILDILATQQAMTLNQIYDYYVSEYAKDRRLIDIMTVRNKLKQLVNYGMIAVIKITKAHSYYLKEDMLVDFSDGARLEVQLFLDFFENIAPLGVIGHFLNQAYFNKIDNTSLFSIKHYYLFNALDSEIVLLALQAIHHKKRVEVTLQSKSTDRIIRKSCTPLRIVYNKRHGRGYLLVYDYQRRNYSSLRLDKVMSIKTKQVDNDFEKYYCNLSTLQKNAWGVYIAGKRNLESVELTLAINDITERYLLRRIEREGKHGRLTKITENTYFYHVKVVDTYEMLPWLRTFLGRIIEIKGSNKKAINTFIDDYQNMLSLYDVQ